MYKTSLLIISFFLAVFSYSQHIIGVPINLKFQKKNKACGYYIEKTEGYSFILHTYGKITRVLYDSSFNLLSSYSIPTDKITLDNSVNFVPSFVTDLQLNGKVFEIYSTSRVVQIIVPDFQKKYDSIVYELNFKEHQKDEKRLAIIPFSEGVRILSFSNKKDKLFLYQWKVNGIIDSIEILLPASTLSTEETRQYSKEYRVNYKTAFEQMNVVQTGSPAIIGNSSPNGVFYEEGKIWILSQTPHWTGYNILELDLKKYSISSFNYILNDMRRNVQSQPENRFIPSATIYKGMLIIKNNSRHTFKYLFYDVNTAGKLREYDASSDSSLQAIINSELVQKGTWLSGSDEKKITKEKAVLRKLSSAVGFLNVAEETQDSLTLTVGAFIPTAGIEGTLMSFTTSMLMSGFANVAIGNFHIIPYLTAVRNKLLYFHTRFSKKSMEFSRAKNITTSLDYLLENFEKQELASSSTVVLKKRGSYFFAIFNEDKKSFDLRKL